MNKLIAVTAAGLAALSLASLASAQIISVQFTNDAANSISAKGQTAGLIPETGSAWNTDASNIPYFAASTTGLSNTTDSTGALTGISFTKTAEAYYGPNYTTTTFLTNTAGNDNLYNHGPLTDYGGTAANLTLSGLNPDDTYTLTLYVENVQPNDASYVVTATDSDDSTFFKFKPMGPGATTFVPAVGLTNATANLANTVQFTGLTGSNVLSVDFADAGFNGFTFNGFQLVDTAGVVTVPEPSAVWMFSLGLLGLMAHVYRKRYARS